MLPPKLREIRERIERKGANMNPSEASLFEELKRLDSLLERLSDKQINEGLVKEGVRQVFGVTSGPDGYCSACGKRL